MIKNDKILVQCKQLLEDRNMTELLKILSYDENREFVVVSGWELIGLLCKQIGYDSNDQNSFNCIKLLQKVCSAKEIILGLDLENCYSENAFLVVITVYTDAFLKLQRGQTVHLKNICKNIVEHLDQLLQNSKNISLKNYQLKANNASNLNQILLVVKKYERFCFSLKDFVLKITEKLIHEKYDDLESYLFEKSIKQNGWSAYDTEACRNILCEFVFKVLEQLIECLPLLKHPSMIEIKSCFTVFVDSVLKIKRITDMFGFYASMKFDISNALCKAESSNKIFIYNNLGFTLFLYLIYIHGLVFQEIPLVYRIESVLLTVMPHLNMMIKRPDAVSFEIGMEFLFYLLSCISCNELEKEHILYKHLLMGFYFVMVWGVNKSRREKAKEAFEELLQKFNARSKFALISHVYESSHHAGMEALCISLMNNLLMTEYPDFEQCQNISSLALKYIEFVGGETHILLDSDRLLAGLNFLRFWFLKDPLHVNKTGIWSKTGEIEKCLNILQHGIDISRHEFEEVIKNGLSKADIEKLQAVSKMISGGTSLNSMEDTEKIATIKKAVCLLELMASIVARIREIAYN
ncbi:glomulin isoform X3 [Hydra vulgaris]|uniref:Glomulin isoform X3 n=1 Tax=Hydra vulgaris TaxID=6087 RepID=A0ABM4BEK4_HYDVU